MKKIKSLIIILLALVVCACFSACTTITSDKSEDFSQTVAVDEIIEITDTIVVIRADCGYMPIDSDTVLIDYMAQIKADGGFDFTVKDGMVVAINGVENPADYSKCWMVYTDDSELSNEAWGTVTVGEITYFSAVVGAEALPIKHGKTYVWEYKSF